MNGIVLMAILKTRKSSLKKYPTHSFEEQVVYKFVIYNSSVAMLDASLHTLLDVISSVYSIGRAELKRLVIFFLERKLF